MERTAVRLAAVGAVAYAALAALSYVVGDAAGVGTFYTATGLVSPLFLVAPVGIALIAAASGAAGRSDPSTMAGVAVVMAATATLLTAVWAVPAAGIVSGVEGVPTVYAVHPWALTATSLALFAGCAGYTAAVLGLVDTETKGP
jgi:hypothetical protein